MNIKVVVVGELQTNCYILEKGDSVLVIDPGSEPEIIAQNIPSNKRVVGIITTHSHDDHTGASLPLINRYVCNLFNGNNLSTGKRVIENFQFEVIETPGHMDDSITIYFPEDKVMFCGDFIFKGGIGRTDMPGASPFDMKLSLKKILEYPDDVTIFPGHYEATVLGNEKKNIEYFMNNL